MSLKKHTRVGAAIFCALALTAAACGKDDGGGGTTPGKPDAQKGLKPGGVLKLGSLREVTHYDPNQAYEVRMWGYQARATWRQMLSYANVEDPKERDTPTPDLATGLPEVSDDGLTYTFTIKNDVKFAPPISREIVAGDFIRAIQRLCDPNGVSGGLSYFTATIKGMTEYCDGFAKIKKESIPAVKEYIESHPIEGLKADGDKKLVITLKQKAGDFPNMMATPFTTPVPVEILNYLTDSNEYRKNQFAMGPYMVESYTPKQNIKLVRNPNWKKETDPLRSAYVDSIEIQFNLASAEAIQQQIEGGQLDMALRGAPPNPAAAKAEREKDPRLHVDKDGSCNFYISFNLHHSTPGGKALQKKQVRQALNWAVDKKAVIQVLGGPRNGDPSGQILTPPLLGYKKIDPYATPESKGDVNKAKEMLAAAGESNLKLVFIYDNNERSKNIVQVVGDRLKEVGITIEPLPRDDATVDTTNPKSDNWDLYFAGWCPDWPGNGARTFFTPLLSDPGLKLYNAGGSYNYGGYDNPAVDEKVEQALAADPEQAADIWADIDAAVMEDAPWIPIYTSNSVNFVSDRVQGFVYFPFSTSADITNISVVK
jgi:peptide/nickel transport system substrate-binding protein